MTSEEDIHVAIVACGDRLEETTVALKALTLFTNRSLYAHVFAEDQLQEGFTRTFRSWPPSISVRFQYRIYPIEFPKDKAAEWKKLFKLCASQRLFIPMLLQDVDALLYIDTDVLFLRPVEEIWSFFYHFNASHLAAAAPEHESPSAGWYNRFARHPYYGSLGINSGVMLMNLTRIRQFQWLEHIDRYYQTYRYNITWGDQDLLNILFHFYPEMLYVFSCSWNYRPDHCMYMSNCAAAEREGVSVVHGNRGVLHNDKQPVFKAVYETIRDHLLEDDRSTLIRKLGATLSAVADTPCSQVAHLFVEGVDRPLTSGTKRQRTFANPSRDSANGA